MVKRINEPTGPMFGKTFHVTGIQTVAGVTNGYVLLIYLKFFTVVIKIAIQAGARFVGNSFSGKRIIQRHGSGITLAFESTANVRRKNPIIPFVFGYHGFF